MLPGAGWASGELPPWMGEHPSYDECVAADTAQDLDAAMDLLAGVEGPGLIAALLADADRHIALQQLAAERAALADEAATEHLISVEYRDHDLAIARRRRVLNDALKADPAAGIDTRPRIA